MILMRPYIYLNMFLNILCYYLIESCHILYHPDLKPKKLINLSCLLIYIVSTIYLLNNKYINN